MSVLNNSADILIRHRADSHKSCQCQFQELYPQLESLVSKTILNYSADVFIRRYVLSSKHLTDHSLVGK